MCGAVAQFTGSTNTDMVSMEHCQHATSSVPRDVVCGEQGAPNDAC